MARLINGNWTMLFNKKLKSINICTVVVEWNEMIEGCE